MSIDRELLELAARAAGLKPPLPMHGPGLTWGHGWWNPLADDGDALRLAVKLGLSLRRDSLDVSVFLRVREMDCGELGHAMLRADPLAATRRAIVRAAAEIGKAMV